MIETILIGHLGQDARVNDVNGRKVVNFSVAHTEKFKDQNGTEINRTLWVECAYWSERTNIAQYLTKGTQVFVRGTISVNQYRNKEGQHAANLRLRVDTIQLLGGKKEDGRNAPAPAATAAAAPVDSEGGDGLPF